MADLTPFVSAFLAITVIVIVGKNKLLRLARFTLMAQAIVVFFATAVAIFTKW